MKRRILFVILVGIVIAIYLQVGRDVKVTNSISMSADNYYEQNLTIVANRLFIYDKEKLAMQLLERCIDNSFYDIRFSYDISGYPDKIDISIYTNSLTERFGKRDFTIQYERNSNSIDTNNYGYDCRIGE